MDDKELTNYLTRIQGTMASLATRIKDLESNWRSVDQDVLSASINREDQASVVIAQLAEFTNQLALQNARASRENDYVGHDIMRRVAIRERADKMRKHEERVKMYNMTRKKSKKVCTCGKHTGIDFFLGKERVIEGFCPLKWWIMQAQIANEEGWLSDFVKKTPVSTTYEFLLKEEKND